MMILEATKKQSFTLSADSLIYIVYFLKYIVTVKVWILLNEISILAFTELAIFHSI